MSTGTNSGSMKLKVTRKHAVVAAGLVLALLLYAWVDGGKEPIRPISEPVPLPEGVQ